jgi:hypothetical protein
MAENKQDVDVLIALRQQRPSYARMVSWEFSRGVDPDGQQARQLLRRKQMKKSKLTISHGLSSGEPQAEVQMYTTTVGNLLYHIYVNSYGILVRNHRLRPKITMCLFSLYLLAPEGIE